MDTRERVAMQMAYDNMVLYSSETAEEWWKHQAGKSVWRKRAAAVCALFAEERAALMLRVEQAEARDALTHADRDTWKASAEAAEAREAKLVTALRQARLKLDRDDWGRAAEIIDAALAGAKGEAVPARPRIVCLCGSTRFMDAFFEAGWNETMAGRIVLSVGVAKHVETPDGGHVGEALGPDVCAFLDELHKRKIDLADDVLVLNVGGYIGESTRSEIEYAQAHGKPVRYLEPALAGAKQVAWPFVDQAGPLVSGCGNAAGEQRAAREEKL